MDTKRIFAWFLDFLITCLIQFFIFSIFIMIPLIFGKKTLAVSEVFFRTLIVTYFSMLFMLVRDLIGKKSPGKRIMKLKIVDKCNGNEATLKQKFFRNITFLLGPVEIIVFLLTKGRIGDRIAGTKIISE